jgi:SAM-dependent methyltransferase
MTPEEVLRFHQQLGREYLAYAYPDSAAVYPTGARRTEAAAAAIHAELGRAPASAVDIGCGRGDLCVLLAAAGATAIGIDFADVMIDEARRRLQSMPQVRDRVAFVCADMFDNGLPPASADAVAALGVLETEPSDERLFAEAHRLLKPGGVFAVSCRNRLFNVVSVNRHTRREAESGGLADLLAEAERWIATAEATRTEQALSEFARSMNGVSRDPRGEPDRPAPPAVRIGETRQHTPESLARSAVASGFRGGTFIGVHPHPLPPALEALAPELYNRVAAAAEAFQREPIGLLWSSAFVGAFSKA